MRNKKYPQYEITPITDLKDLVVSKAQSIPDKIAFTYSEKKSIISKSFKDVYDDTLRTGAFLYSQGLKNAHIGIIGENSYEWLIAFFAATNGGNAAVPIDKELPPDKIAELLRQADCSAAFISDSYSDAVRCSCDIPVFSLNKLSSLSEPDLKYKTEFEEFIVSPDSMAAIFFASGTTGDNKGVMLSHKNMASNINAACQNFDITGKTLSVLPYNHTFSLNITILSPFFRGHQTHINQSLKRLQTDLKTVSPKLMGVVPLFIETYYKMIIQTAKKNNSFKKLTYAGKISNILLKFGIDLRRKFFKDVLDSFGGELEYLVCGGAFLDPKYVKEFRTWGIQIINGYGITECSPVIAVNRNHHWRDDSVGQILKCNSVRIAEDGEILVKGDNVMLGYYKNDAENKKLFSDGWYKTGDLGFVDKDGFLFLTGRKKNLIILSNGENVSPEGIEEQLLSSFDEIKETVVSGKNGMIVAEIFPSEEYLNDQKHFEELIDRFNSEKPNYLQIQRVILRDTEFEKNSAKKIIRSKITEELT